MVKTWMEGELEYNSPEQIPRREVEEGTHGTVEDSEGREEEEEIHLDQERNIGLLLKICRPEHLGKI